MNIPREKRIGKFSLDIALRKTGKGYGIGSLLLTCNLLCSGSFSSVVNCQLTSSELTALTNISSVHSARYIVHICILLGFPKRSLEELIFKAQFQQYFSKWLAWLSFMISIITPTVKQSALV